MALTAHMPPWLHQTLAAQLEGISRNDLAARAEAISERYRNRGNSEAIRSAHDALAYALVRMPATYAALRSALEQAALRRPEFAPASLLDIGCGPGTALWAAADDWPSLRRATLLDQNPFLLQLGRALAANCPIPVQSAFRAATLPVALDKVESADLVVASYALTELPAKQLPGTLARLWELTGQMLTIVEPGTPDGFARLLACRSQLIAAGAHLAAPCTHHEACPLAGSAHWCHFSQRLPRTRDHRLVKAAEVNFEDERFCYLIACKEPLAEGGRRILATPLLGKQAVRLSLCAPDAVEERAIDRRQKQAYKAARHYGWGEAVKLP